MSELVKVTVLAPAGRRLVGHGHRNVGEFFMLPPEEAANLDGRDDFRVEKKSASSAAKTLPKPPVVEKDSSDE